MKIEIMSIHSTKFYGRTETDREKLSGGLL